MQAMLSLVSASTVARYTEYSLSVSPRASLLPKATVPSPSSSLSSSTSSLSSSASTSASSSSPPPPPPPPPSSSSSSSSSSSLDQLTSTSKQEWTQKGSPQLIRWARTRRIRHLAPRKSIQTVSPAPTFNGSATTSQSESDREMFPPPSRPDNIIYMVSDGTGWTAEHCVSAALGQFDHCLVDQGCPVNTHLFSQIDDAERLLEIIKDACKENATFVYTLADPALAETAKKACRLYRIPSLDILGPITELLSSHMGVAPLGLPRGAGLRNVALSEEYFKRIEAIEFTIKQDDGALPKNLHKADLVLVGVSRTSKTPLSTYMAQKGYKVANVPLVFGIAPPKELFEIDQNRIYALTIDANFLQTIRIARYKTLGVSSTSFYSDMDHIKHELEYSNKLFSQNPTWPVIAVTGKAIEETAAVILRIYHDRSRKHTMPRISYRY